MMNTGRLCIIFMCEKDALVLGKIADDSRTVWKTNSAPIASANRNRHLRMELPYQNTIGKMA